MEIRRSYILCERYFRSSVARWWRRGRHPLPRTRIRKAGAGHAPALIINYSGRFGSRLGNEVIFLPGRRQRRRRRHRHLSFRLRLRRPPMSPLSCSRSRRKVFTHVTTSRDSVCKAADTFIRLLCMYTIATHFRVPLMRVETRSTDVGIYLRKISAVLLFNRENLENTDTRKFEKSEPSCRWTFRKK